MSTRQPPAPKQRLTKRQMKQERRKKKLSDRKAIEQYYRQVTGDQHGSVGKDKQLSMIRASHEQQQNKERLLANLISGATAQLTIWWILSLFLINIDTALRLLLVFGSVPVLYGLSIIAGKGVPDIRYYQRRPVAVLPKLFVLPPKRIFVTLLVAQMSFLFAQWFAGNSASEKISSGASALEVILVCVLPSLLGLALMMVGLVGFFSILVTQKACGLTSTHQMRAYLIIDAAALTWTLGKLLLFYIVW